MHVQQALFTSSNPSTSSLFIMCYVPTYRVALKYTYRVKNGADVSFFTRHNRQHLVVPGVVHYTMKVAAFRARTLCARTDNNQPPARSQNKTSLRNLIFTGLQDEEDLLSERAINLHEVHPLRNNRNGACKTRARKRKHRRLPSILRLQQSEPTDNTTKLHMQRTNSSLLKGIYTRNQGLKKQASRRSSTGA